MRRTPIPSSSEHRILPNSLQLTHFLNRVLGKGSRRHNARLLNRVLLETTHVDVCLSTDSHDLSCSRFLLEQVRCLLALDLRLPNVARFPNQLVLPDCIPRHASTAAH